MYLTLTLRVQAPYPCIHRVTPYHPISTTQNEAESEWSQHAAKSVIDTGAKGGLRNALPSNFPYFYADFAVDKGFLHVVDDEESFDFDVGRNTGAAVAGPCWVGLPCEG